jgi:hypothetical protein
VISLPGSMSKQSMTLHQLDISLTCAWCTITRKELVCSSCETYSERSSRNFDRLSLLMWCEVMRCNLIISNTIQWNEITISLFLSHIESIWRRKKWLHLFERKNKKPLFYVINIHMCVPLYL